MPLTVCVLHFIASFHESYAWHIFDRIDTETEVAFALIAEPVQEPPAGEPQPGEVVDQASEEATNPADLQGKPRSISLILITPCYI